LFALKERTAFLKLAQVSSAKANDGKQIARHMIEGYKELNTNITNTINLISDIEMSSKEQLSGIEQINDAVTQLDQQTQQNAMSASQAHDVAVITDEIAKLVVSNADAKEFIGKNEVKAKDLNLQSNSSYDIKPVQTLHKKPQINTTIKNNHKIAKNEIKVISTNSNDEWESF